MRLKPQGTSNVNSTAPGCAIPTAGEIFANGKMIELVCGNGELALLSWDGMRPRVAESFEFGDRTYVPVPLRPSLLRAVRFPSGARDYQSTRKLYVRILEEVKKHDVLLSSELRLVAFWIMSTWLADASRKASTLVLSGPSPAEVYRFLRLLQLLCRRAVLLTELTPAGLLALPMQLRPTILIDQSRLTQSMRGLLRASCNRGTYVTRAGDFLDLHCAKAVYSAKNHLDTDLTENLLQVAVVPAESSSALLDEREENRIAAEFQPLLLRYRLQNYRAAQESAFDAPGFTTGVRELAQSLGTSIVGDAELASEVIPLLSAKDDDVRARRTTLPEFGIITALLSFVHEGKEQQIMVKKFTQFVNTVLRNNGEIFEYNPEEIGHRLAAMGLFTSRVAGGKGIKLTRGVSRLAHDLKRRYGVTTSPSSFPGCPDCELTETTDRKRLL